MSLAYTIGIVLATLLYFVIVFVVIQICAWIFSSILGCAISMQNKRKRYRNHVRNITYGSHSMPFFNLHTGTRELYVNAFQFAGWVSAVGGYLGVVGIDPHIILTSTSVFIALLIFVFQTTIRKLFGSIDITWHDRFQKDDLITVMYGSHGIHGYVVTIHSTYTTIRDYSDVNKLYEISNDIMTSVPIVHHVRSEKHKQMTNNGLNPVFVQ
jgi:small-conductance mechanosensitive channel